MISLEKKDQVSLRKSAGVSLEKHGLSQQRARVVLVLDDSASMEGLYRDGLVQAIAERMVALAAAWAPEPEVAIFKLNGQVEVGKVNASNFTGWVNAHIEAEGSTPFSPVLRAIVRSHGNPPGADTPLPPQPGFLARLLGKKPGPLPPAPRASVPIPTYVLFITDGEVDHNDRDATREAIRAASAHAIFFQFVGLGNARFQLLNELDTMEGRVVDNANFFALPASDTPVDDEWLYSKMLVEFPGWVPQVKALGILA